VASISPARRHELQHRWMHLGHRHSRPLGPRLAGDLAQDARAVAVGQVDGLGVAMTPAASSSVCARRCTLKPAAHVLAKAVKPNATSSVEH
jgi:hypothetical protein